VITFNINLFSKIKTVVVKNLHNAFDKTAVKRMSRADRREMEEEKQVDDSVITESEPTPGVEHPFVGFIVKQLERIFKAPHHCAPKGSEYAGESFWLISLVGANKLKITLKDWANHQANWHPHHRINGKGLKPWFDLSSKEINEMELKANRLRFSQPSKGKSNRLIQQERVDYLNAALAMCLIMDYAEGFQIKGTNQPYGIYVRANGKRIQGDSGVLGYVYRQESSKTFEVKLAPTKQIFVGPLGNGRGYGELGAKRLVEMVRDAIKKTQVELKGSNAKETKSILMGDPSNLVKGKGHWSNMQLTQIAENAIFATDINNKKIGKTIAKQLRLTKERRPTKTLNEEMYGELQNHTMKRLMSLTAPSLKPTNKDMIKKNGFGQIDYELVEGIKTTTTGPHGIFTLRNLLSEKVNWKTGAAGSTYCDKHCICYLCDNAEVDTTFEKFMGAAMMGYQKYDPPVIIPVRSAEQVPVEVTTGNENDAIFRQGEIHESLDAHRGLFPIWEAGDEWAARTRVSYTATLVSMPKPEEYAGPGMDPTNPDLVTFFEIVAHATHTDSGTPASE
jgi:hypothetical protein